MLFDRNLLVSENQAITASGFTVSTNTVDMLAEADTLRGEPLYLNVLATESFAGGTATSLFALPFMSPTAVLNPSSTDNIPLGTTNQLFRIAGHLTEGSRHSVALSPISDDWFNVLGSHNRYLGVRYQTDGTFSFGQVSAWFAPQPIADTTIMPSARSMP